jgi:xanthine dehydrogenase YagR molybdenum-binding subunit
MNKPTEGIPLSAQAWSAGAPDPLMHRQGLIGKARDRVDGPDKVQGKARFAAEVYLDNMLYAALLGSTIARGRIASIDTTEAEAAPGVALVMTYQNAPRMQAPTLMMQKPKAAGASDLPVMQDAEIHWNGQAVALVLAETQDQAEHAVTLIRVEYEAAPAMLSFAAAQRHARVPETVLGEPATIEKGEAEAALRGAPVQTDQLYHTPRHNHNAIELHAATVAWDGDNLTVHDATQMVNATSWTLAQIFGIDEKQVRVLSPYVGGGFGGKGLWNHQILAAAAARLVGRPVRIVLTREGVFRHVGGRTTTVQRVALGGPAGGILPDGRPAYGDNAHADPEGGDDQRGLSALIHTGIAAMTAHNACPEQFTFPARHLYQTAALKVEQQVADMDMIANTFMRAPGESVGTFALESAIDELAEKMGRDPIELRLSIEPEQDPSSGAPFSSRHLREAWQRGAERFGWEHRNPVPRSRQEGEWLIGMGCATATYPYMRMAGGAARIRINADGGVIVEMASHEMGMGTATVQAQHVAERLAVDIDKVRFVYGDTSLPSGTLAGGSSQTASIGAAIIAASEALITALLQLATSDSPLAGLRFEDVEARDGGLVKRDDPARHQRYADLLGRAGRDELAVQADAPKPGEMKKFSMHSYGAQFCEVKVSAITGEVRVTRFVGAFDAGRILNAKTATSQFKGGIVMGLGLALMEETLFDERSGRIMNPSLAGYHVPVQMDVPDIEVLWTDIPDPHTPLGAHGIGEIGITGVGAAVANAVYNATGKRIRSLPITLDKLL